MPKFAISDIHGCVKTFQTLLEKIKFSKDDELYLLGDYIDRGPDSKGVIDLIWDYQEAGYQIECLRGNHEQMLLDMLQGDWEAGQIWTYNGGKETMSSFGVSEAHHIPRQYIDFFKNCHYYLEVDNYILVHAGLNFEYPNPLEGKHSMLWIRRWYGDIDKDWLNGRIVVHGHTPTTSLQIEDLLYDLKKGSVLNIDGGCVFRNRRIDMGQLVAFDMTNQKLIFQPCRDVTV